MGIKVTAGGSGAVGLGQLMVEHALHPARCRTASSST